MSIVMIRGPEEPGPGLVSAPVPEAVYATLSQCAERAGQPLLVYNCGTEDELIERLHRTRRDQADIVLLDPGRCVRASQRLREALSQLQMPYIEVHDDQFDALEPVITPRSGPRVTVVNGYAAQSYTLAMWVALEQIGCAECANDIHVGT